MKWSRVEMGGLNVAIVDYGMGNLFSVKHACLAVGLHAELATERADVLTADAVIVPGVGAFGDAMEALRRLDLVGPLRDVAASGKPLFGICLGMQLFMSESEEFGGHRGIGLIDGPVIRFRGELNGRPLKVPHIGWSQIYENQGRQMDIEGSPVIPAAWSGTPLDGLQEGERMYFVHSFYPVPEDADVVLTRTRYGPVEFASTIRRGNIFACQFHPERSGKRGIKIYRNIAAQLTARVNQPEE